MHQKTTETKFSEMNFNTISDNHEDGEGRVVLESVNKKSFLPQKFSFLDLIMMMKAYNGAYMEENELEK